MLEPFQLPFVQHALAEVLLLSLAGGLIGTWILLRGLAFYSHAVGTAAFPGLVLADGLGFAAPLGALGAAALLAGGVALLSRARRSSYDSATAVVLVGSLALGVILASDLFHSGANVETLLFGSLLVLDGSDIAIAGAVAALALLLTATLGPRWLVRGFDAGTARSLGAGSGLFDAALLALVAAVAVAALSAVGALLATALLVVPAATTRLWTRTLAGWQLATVLLTAALGTAGVWMSVETDAPPGATIAVLAGAAFALSAAARALAGRTRTKVPATTALAASLVLLLGVTGCGTAASGDSGKPVVVATTTQLGDFARAVGGERVAVHQILRPNTDPHDYEPRPSDVLETARAKVVLESGDELDNWMGTVVERSGGKPDVVDLAQAVPIRRAGEPGGGEGSRYDPHWWHDPRNAAAAVRRIRDALAAADPGGAAVYRLGAARYLAAVGRLDRDIARCFAAVPAAQRKLVTDHDAFGYFAARYGVRVIGAVIPSQATQAQPSAGATAKLAALVRREHVTAIFPETSLNPKLAEALARETGASAHHALYGDTLGPEGSSGATYLSMERANADAMVRAFTAGARGCA